MSSTPSSSVSAATLNWDARLWGALIVLCGVIFLDAVDVSMVGVALPSIQTDLDMSNSALQWVMSGYILGYGGFLLLGGRAADLLGRRRVLLVALGVFAVASLLGGVVTDGGLLVAARFIKGMSAAFTAPAALSIITTTFAEGPARNRALSIFSVSGASGFSFGLVFSGLLTEVGWRWTFLMPVPLALIVLFAGLRFVPRASAPERDGRGYDVAGAVTITGGMLALVYGVVEAPEAGWTAPSTIGLFAVAVALLTAFIVIEMRSSHPLVRLGILRSGTLARANLGAVTFFGAFIGFQFVLTLYLQALLGWAPLEMALVLLPAALIVAFSSVKMGSVIDRFGTQRMIFIGVAAHVAAYALFLRTGLAPDVVWDIMPSMILVGVGFAVAFPALNVQATQGVGDGEQGLAGGLLNTSIQVGGAIWLAIVTAVVTAGGAGETATAAQTLASFRPGLVVVTGASVIGLLVALSGMLARRGRHVTQVAPEREPELAGVAD